MGSSNAYAALAWYASAHLGEREARTACFDEILEDIARRDSAPPAISDGAARSTSRAAVVRPRHQRLHRRAQVRPSARAGA